MDPALVLGIDRFAARSFPPHRRDSSRPPSSAGKRQRGSPSPRLTVIIIIMYKMLLIAVPKLCCNPCDATSPIALRRARPAQPYHSGRISLSPGRQGCTTPSGPWKPYPGTILVINVPTFLGLGLHRSPTSGLRPIVIPCIKFDIFKRQRLAVARNLDVHRVRVRRRQRKAEVAVRGDLIPVYLCKGIADL